MSKIWTIIFSIWTIIALALWFFSGDPAMVFGAVGVLISGLSAVLFWKFRKPISEKIKRWRSSPKTKFIIIGSLAAVFVEFEFWVIEIITGASVAASSNLFLDLLGTMPWYIIMAWLLYKVEIKYSYSFFEILILGGIYDLFGDGILGSVLGGAFSPFLLLLFLIIFPIFVLSYSFIVILPSYLLKDELNKIRIPKKQGFRKYIYALLPLLGLLIYGIISFILFAGG